MGPDPKESVTPGIYFLAIDEQGSPVAFPIRRDSGGNPALPVMTVSGSVGGGGGGGGLSVTDEAAFTPGVSQFTPTGGQFTVSGSEIQGTVALTTFRAFTTAETDMAPATLAISAVDVGTTTSSGIQGQSLITGTPTPNSSATFAVNGDTTFVLEVSGSFTGVLVFEKAVSPTQFVATGMELVGTSNSGQSKSVSSVYSPAVIKGNDAGIGLFRIRALSFSGGTANIKIISGAGTSDVSIGNNGQTSYSQPNPVSGTFTTATALNTALSWYTAGMGTVVLTSVETGTTTTAGALTFEVFDGVTWWPITGQQIGSYTTQQSYALVNNTNVAWQFDIAGWQQFRVRLSTAITGTGSPQVALILQPNGAPNDITPTVGWAQRLDAVNDAVSAYPFGHTYTNITTATTTTVKSGAGVLHALTINTPVASSVITFYDNTAGSGAKMRTITLPATLVSDGPISVIVDEAFNTGLTIVTATGASDITVSWR